MPFGYLLKHYRLEKGLSQRKLGQLASVDNAYIDRLERRSKDRPSADTVRKLVRGLGLAGRDEFLLSFVAAFRQYVDVEMIRYTLEHLDITAEEFSWAVAIKFRTHPGVAIQLLFSCARLVSEVVDLYLKRKGQNTRFRLRLPVLPGSKPSGR